LPGQGLHATFLEILQIVQEPRSSLCCPLCHFSLSQ
jgi:hypothetical protein